MPPHSSHILQPLDVSCFAVLKRSYSRQIEEVMQVGYNHIKKPDFLTAYLTAHKESMIIDTIRSGFTATGLVLYDPEQVLSKLNTQLRTPTPPLPPSNEPTNWVPETPHNIYELQGQATAIKSLIRDRTRGSSSPTDQAIRPLVKGC